MMIMKMIEMIMKKIEVAIDYNAGFTCDLAALVQFGLGKKRW